MVFIVGDPGHVVEHNRVVDELLALPTTYAALAYARPGTGSPEGVLSANPGARYIDTDATRGAIEWVKATGTGNTGWRVVYGDTGRRALITWTSGGVVTNHMGGTGLNTTAWAPRTGQAGGIWVRRLNYDIEFYVTNIQTAMALAAFAVPVLFGMTSAQQTNLGLRAGMPFAGWRPMATSNPNVPRWVQATDDIVWAVDTATASGVVISNANEAIMAAKAMSTTPWPTSLLGIAA